MLFHFEHHVEVAGRSAIRSGFALAGDPQTRSGIHAGWNAQLDGAFAFDAPLPAAIEAAFFNNLPRALAVRARARDGEKSLLVRHLAAAAARLAGLHAGALLRSGAVAGFAIFLARQFDFGGYAAGRFFKRQRHVIAQIGAALRARTSAAAPSTKKILEAKKITKNIVEVLKHRAIESAGAARAR